MVVAAVGLALARTSSVTKRRRRIPSIVTVNNSVPAAKSGKIAHDGREPSQVIGGGWSAQIPGVNSAVGGAGAVSFRSIASRSTSAMSWTLTSSSRWASFTPSSIIT